MQGSRFDPQIQGEKSLVAQLSVMESYFSSREGVSRGLHRPLGRNRGSLWSRVNKVTDPHKFVVIVVVKGQEHQRWGQQRGEPELPWEKDEQRAQERARHRHPQGSPGPSSKKGP